MKQILELAERVGSTHKQNLGVYQFYQSELEELGDLIVKQCIQVLKDTGYPNIHGNCVGVEELKQHFGVSDE